MYEPNGAKVNAISEQLSKFLWPTIMNNEYSEVMAMDDLKIMVRASSNSPSVLGGILLSSQPEQVQDLVLYLALLHPGRQFHSRPETSGYTPSL